MANKRLIQTAYAPSAKQSPWAFGHAVTPVGALMAAVRRLDAGQWASAVITNTQTGRRLYTVLRCRNRTTITTHGSR